MFLRFLAFVLMMSLGAVNAAPPGGIFAPSEPVAGMTQAELSIRWWQWAFSFDRVRSPISDRTGEMCASRQNGDVWFLAGTYGTQRTKRACIVPYGKVLFIPLINYVTFRGEGTGESCMSLAARSAALTNNPSALVLEMDGKHYDKLRSHRIATTCFSLVPGQPADAVADGYYVAVKPLPRGSHVLHFGGVLPDMAQAVTYELHVK